jgi:hypothetical protein
MKHLPLAVTAAAAVTMLGLPPAPAQAQAPAGPAGSCAAITGAAGGSYHAALALSRAAAAERAVRDGALAARDDRASQQNMSRFYAAVGRGLARNCYLGHPATGPARR